MINEEDDGREESRQLRYFIANNDVYKELGDSDESH